MAPNCGGVERAVVYAGMASGVRPPLLGHKQRGYVSEGRGNQPAGVKFGSWVTRMLLKAGSCLIMRRRVEAALLFSAVVLLLRLLLLLGLQLLRLDPAPVVPI